jgi:PAS domain-containing protein
MTRSQTRGGGSGTPGKPQQQIELILMRQLASYLTIPIFLVGADESLVFYNEAAGALVGRRFDEVGAIGLDELTTRFQVVAQDGSPLDTNDLAIARALRERRPGHDRVRYRALDGTTRLVDVTAFPLEGQGGRHLGAVAIFWETDGP